MGVASSFTRQQINTLIKDVEDKDYIKGCQFYAGIGVDENKSEAFKYFEKAANNGNMIALNNVGVFYQNGIAVKQNRSEAFDCYNKAAKMGFAISQGNLSVCYQKGIGIKQNIDQAIYWYQKAAEQGYSSSHLLRCAH